jgi:hypothetical protein
LVRKRLEQGAESFLREASGRSSVGHT